MKFSVCIPAEICFFIQFLIKFHHMVDLFLSNFQSNLFSEFFASFNLFIKFVSRFFLYRRSIIRFQLNRNNRKIINVQQIDNFEREVNLLSSNNRIRMVNDCSWGERRVVRLNGR